MSRIRRRPMNTTQVEEEANASIKSGASRPCRSVAVPIHTDEATPLKVSGMPANPASEVPVEMPGTYVQERPNDWAKAISSPALPNIMASPPFRRTICRPSMAASRISSWMPSCGVLSFPARLPTHTTWQWALA